MTVTAYVRVTHPGQDDVIHPATVVDASDNVNTPSIIDVPDFGLYGVGVHPELGPLAMFVLPTPGTDPEPALTRIVDGRLEVGLLADRITLVVEGHPLPGASQPDPAAPVANSGADEPA